MSAQPAPARGGPPPLVPAVAYGVLMVASVIVSASGPRTSTSAAEALRYARNHGDQLRVAALLGAAAALPLVIWAATMYHKLAGLVDAPGPVMALVAGPLAAAALTLSSVITWTLAGTAGSADPGLARALVDFSFVSGAAGFVVPCGLLIAGVAVPALFARLLHPVLAWVGVVIAAIAFLSTFTLVTSALDPTLPIGRFGGLIWIIAASLTMSAADR